jgi:threonine/homoserine/homoserine lactone efflux protein
MLAICAYAIGIMYTPGPINLLGLNSGIHGNARHHIGFFAGVACAMFILFILLGFLGLSLLDPVVIPYLSLAGCSYIFYIACKLLRGSVTFSESKPQTGVLTFWNGLLMQLLNPKALVATLPIATIQFPAVGITGSAIVFWSLLLALLAFGAPASYSLLGIVMGKRIENPRYFKNFNLLMSGLLVYVSLSLGYEHVYQAL